MARSQHLAEFELYWGDANLLKLELDHYLAVSAEDIKRVAGTYFDAKQRTVLDVLPGAAPASREK
jgi:zinc protease